MTLKDIAVLISEISVLLSVIIPVIVMIKKIVDGQRCQLRSEMLQIYYHNKDSKKIRQYEKENFIMLYEAYKALKGNSFIDTIHDEVVKWETIM